MKNVTRTFYGYLCGRSYIDFDGSHETAEWIEDASHTERGGEPDTFRYPDSLGWYAECLVEPEAGLIGPFTTEAEAIQVATDEDLFFAWTHRDEALGPDPLGDWHGQNV